MTRFKICGLTREQDVLTAVEAGAHAVGFVLEPSSPRCVTPAEASRLAQLAEPYCTSVAVYGNAAKPYPPLSVVQAISFESELPLRTIITVRLKPSDRVEDIIAAGQDCRAILLDGFSQAGYGGTGTRVDWDLAAEVVRASARPVILAGGLTPDNVGKAILQVRPYAVDVSSGVESAPGVKDAGAIRAFARAVIEADNSL